MQAQVGVDVEPTNAAAGRDASSAGVPHDARCQVSIAGVVGDDKHDASGTGAAESLSCGSSVQQNRFQTRDLGSHRVVTDHPGSVNRSAKSANMERLFRCHRPCQEFVGIEVRRWYRKASSPSGAGDYGSSAAAGVVSCRAGSLASYAGQPIVESKASSTVSASRSGRGTVATVRAHASPAEVRAGECLMSTPARWAALSIAVAMPRRRKPGWVSTVEISRVVGSHSK